MFIGAPGETDGQREEKLRFHLRRAARQYGNLDLSLLTRALMSTTATDDLRQVNPFLSSGAAAVLLSRLPETLLRLNRVAHARRALAALARVRGLLDKAVAAASAGGGGASEDAVTKVLQAAKALTTQLVSRRHYAKVSTEGTEGAAASAAAAGAPWAPSTRGSWSSSAFDLPLRGRQGNGALLRGRVATGESRVQQMIMGAGKTTVIGPLRRSCSRTATTS